MSIVKKTQVKKRCKEFQIGSDYIEGLDRQVEWLIQESCKRAKASGRTTLMGRDA